MFPAIVAVGSFDFVGPRVAVAVDVMVIDEESVSVGGGVMVSLKEIENVGVADGVGGGVMVGVALEGVVDR